MSLYAILIQVDTVLGLAQMIGQVGPSLHKRPEKDLTADMYSMRPLEKMSL